MKNVIIIGTYPNEPYKVDMLNECIEKVKPLGYDIMVVSHYPIPSEIQSKVDYVLYDKENSKVNQELTPNWTYHTDSFNIRKFNGEGHILAVTKNIYNGINLANNLKYDFFFYMEYDNIFNIDDLIRIEILKNTMFANKKRMILFGYKNQGHNMYETLMFGGSPSYFIKNISLPTKENDLEGQSISLERIFYDKHKDNHDSFYVIHKSSKEFFHKSEINKEFAKYIIEVFGSNKESELYFFSINLNQNPNPIKVKINGGEFKEICPGCWHLNRVGLGSILTVEIICDERKEIKEFDLTDGDILKFLKRGFINFN
jgi:hypothetical protein